MIIEGCTVDVFGKEISRNLILVIRIPRLNSLPSLNTYDSMAFAPATILPIKHLHDKSNIKSTHKQGKNPSHNFHIILNLKPYHNSHPNSNSLEKFIPEQLSQEQNDVSPFSNVGYYLT